MSRRLGILAAVLAWLFLAGPAVLAAAERADSGIEVRNGTRTQNLARLTRTLLSQQGFNVVQIGNYIDFGVEATVIYYRPGAEKVARALQSEVFPGARLEESSRLHQGVGLKVLLGSDLLAQPRMRARLLGEEESLPPPAVKSPTPESGLPSRFAAARAMPAPVNVSTPTTVAPTLPPSLQPPLPQPAPAARSEASQHRAVLAAAERADTGIEIRNGTRTQNLAHLTRTLLAQQGFNVVQIGNYIDFGVETTVIYYRTGAEKVARALQSEVFPGARLEASSRLQNGIDLRVLLGSDLLGQPRVLARLLGDEESKPPSAVPAPAPESEPPPRSAAVQVMPAPVNVCAPASAASTGPPSLQPPLPALAAKSEASQHRGVLTAAETADTGIEIRNGTRTQNLAHLTRTLMSQQGFNVVQIGNYIDFGVEATVIYYRTGAEKVARKLRFEIFPGARLEASSRLQNGIDLKVLLGSDLLGQPRVLARLLVDEESKPPSAVPAPAPESEPPSRSSAAQAMPAPAAVEAPVTAAPAQQPNQAPPLPAAAAPDAGSSQRQAVLTAAEGAAGDTEVRPGTDAQELADLTRTLWSQPDCNLVQLGNQINSGMAGTVIHCQTEAEQAAQSRQSEVFPGANLEASTRPQNGIDLKVFLGSDLLAQPLMLARLLGRENSLSPLAVKAPTSEAGLSSRSPAAEAMPAPVIASAPVPAAPAQQPNQAPPLPAAAAPDAGASQRQVVLTAAEGAAGDTEVRPGNDAQELADLTRTLWSQPDCNLVQLGNQIISGMAGTVIHCRTEAEQAARSRQSEVFPGASLEASSRPQNGIDLKGFLGSDLLAQPLMLARLLGGEKLMPPLAVKAPTSEAGLSSRSPAADPVIASAPAPVTAAQPPSQPPLTVAPAFAAGAIRCYIDSRGVLHIGNVPASQPGPSQPISPGVIREAMLTEPQRSRSRPVRLVARTEETYAPESILEAFQKVCQGLAQGETQAYEFDGIIAAAVQAGDEQKAAEVALDYNYLPARQISPEPGGIPVPAPRPGAPKIGEAAVIGDIQRYCDARGVLHIGNVPPSQPKPSQPDSPGVVREAILAEPRRSRSRPVRVVAQTEETYTPESLLEAYQKACRGLPQDETQAHEFDGIIAAAAQAGAEQKAVEVALDYNYLPPRQVSRDQQVIPAPVPPPAAPTISAAATPGDIRRYCDARGVLHLSNTAPKPHDLGSAVQMVQSPDNQASEARELGQPVATPPWLPFRQAAWSLEEHRLAAPPDTSSPAKQAAPRSPGPIWEYRDSKNVIHISNVEAEPPQAPAAAGLMARSSAPPGFEPQTRRPSLETAGGLDWRPAAWNGEGGLKLLKRVKKAARSQTAEVITEGGIRRYRDKKGVLHIKTVEYPLPPGVVLPSRQAGSTPLDRMAAAPAAPAVPSAPASSNLSGSAAPPANPSALNGGQARITAFKDAQGRLRISTALPQPVPGKMPSLPVYAELEPIILQAAQIYRLPPTLIKAVIKAESNFCSWAVSPKGAMGLMQLMPGTAELLGVREPFNPQENVFGGCRYLRELIDLFGGNLTLALASYNAGFQRVIDCGYQIPSIKETQDFVTKVMGRYVTEEQRERQPST